METKIESKIWIRLHLNKLEREPALVESLRDHRDRAVL